MKKETDYVKINGRSISDLVVLSIEELRDFFDHLELSEHDVQVADRLLNEIRTRLRIMCEVGLGYLTLNRTANTLSGGESQRINLATSLGSSLVGSLYVLDEPSIGLHSRDTQCLINVLKQLRDLGNTVVVVEHDEEIMRAADWIIDIGPEAFSKLGNDYQLLIAGEPYGSFSKYQKIIDASGCSERIHLFLSYIKDSEVGRYFSASDLAVLPYRSATQSGISSVAYHFELPLVVTDVGGLRETIGERGTGLVAQSVTADAVLAEIRKYFADPALKESCIENIRKEKTRLSWMNFCRRLEDFAAGL